MKHIETPQESNKASENLNISDVMKSLSIEEQEMIQKGKNHWSLDILSKRRRGYVYSRTIKEVIDKVIENTWRQAKIFYGNRSEADVSGSFGPNTYEEQLNKINQLPQTQTSLMKQLEILRPFANRLGLYDAADYLRNDR